MSLLIALDDARVIDSAHEHATPARLPRPVPLLRKRSSMRHVALADMHIDGVDLFSASDEDSTPRDGIAHAR